MLSEGDKAWLRAFFADIGVRLDKIEERVGKIEERQASIEQRQASLEKCVDGVFEYVRKVVEGDHVDAEHAEREAAEALKALGELELERIRELENHERSVRQGGGE